MIFKETRIKSLSFAVRDSRSPTYAAHFSAFLICLSYRLCPIRPCGAPSPRGEGCDTRIPSSKKGGEAATFIPHSSKAFIQGQGTARPMGYPPLYLISQNRSVFSFAHFVSTSSETPMYCESALAT